MANFPPERYTFDAIYVLSNGYYIDFKQNGPEHQAIVKTPEGAVWTEGDSSFAGTPQVLVNEEVTLLSHNLEIADLSVIEIIQKQAPPPPKKNIQFNVEGRVLTSDGTPISTATIKGYLFEKPQPLPPSPNAGGADPLQYTDLENTTFALGAAISLAPVSVDENGRFILEYYGENEIDFSQTYVEVKAEKYFPKSVGPTLTKTGEKSVTKQQSTGKFQGTTTLVSEKISQLSDGTYKVIAVYKNSSTGKESEGEGLSLSRETAKKLAKSNSEKNFTNNNPKEESFNIDIYDLGKIVLQSEEVNLDAETAKLKADIQIGENKIIENIAKKDLGFEVRISSLFAKQKENLKRVMLPAILTIISSFGPSIVNSILSNKKNALDDTVCPDPEKIKLAIRKRNKLVRDLNRSYKIVRTVSKILNVTGALLIGLRVGLGILQVLTTIPTTPFTPFGLKAFYSGLIEKGFKISEKTLEKAGIAVTILSILAGTIGVVLGAIIDLLNKLDFMLQSCSQEEVETTLPNGTVVRRPAVSFLEINNELNTFIDSSTGEVEDIIDPLTGQPYPYKGFTFEIKNDTSQDFQYPKRYAIARNVQGIQVLRSESSFASSPEILIEELKFAIDRDNLRAD